jgi:hypothetical protein
LDFRELRTVCRVDRGNFVEDLIADVRHIGDHRSALGGNRNARVTGKQQFRCAFCNSLCGPEQMDFPTSGRGALSERWNEIRSWDAFDQWHTECACTPHHRHSIRQTEVRPLQQLFDRPVAERINDEVDIDRRDLMCSVPLPSAATSSPTAFSVSSIDRLSIGTPNMSAGGRQ